MSNARIVRRLNNKPHVVQRGFHQLYRFKKGVLPAILITYAILPTVSEENKALAACALVNIFMQLHDGLEPLFNRQDPFLYLRDQGAGNVYAGLVKEWGKFSGALVPSSLTGLGMGYTIKNFLIAAQTAPDPILEFIAKIFGKDVSSIPLYGLVGWAVHGGATTFIERAVEAYEVEEEINPALRKIQYVGKGVERLFSGTFMFEVMRLGALVKNQTWLHNPYCLLLVVVFDQAFIFWKHWATEKEPLVSLLALPAQPAELDIENASTASHEPTPREKAGTLSWFALRGMCASLACFLAFMCFIRAISDPEKLSTAERMLFEMFLILIAQVTEALIAQLPSAGRQLQKASWCGLFAAKEQGKVKWLKDPAEEPLTVSSNADIVLTSPSL